MTTTYELYYSPGACSMAPHVLVHELGQKIDLHKVDLKAPRSPEFLKINPRGQVPTLIDNGQVIMEGAAILIHLCEKHKSDLLPSSGIERDQALQALMFCNATLHPAYGKFMFVARSSLDEVSKLSLQNEACEKIQQLWNQIDETLGQQKYMAGDKVTVADILMTVIANWAWISKPPKLGKNVQRVISEISRRPSYQLALQHEGVEYKAAA